jgi:hypothetical protein
VTPKSANVRLPVSPPVECSLPIQQQVGCPQFENYLLGHHPPNPQICNITTDPCSTYVKNSFRAIHRDDVANINVAGSISLIYVLLFSV